MVDCDTTIHEQVQKTTTEFDQTQQLDELPDASNSSGWGYAEMSMVYKNPSTGKLIIVGVRLDV